MKTTMGKHTKSRISHFMGTILSTVISLFLTPILACVVLFTILRRSIVSLYLRLKYGSKIKLIDCMDSFQVFDRPNNTLDTYTFLVIEGTANLDKISAAVSKKLLNSEENLYEKLMCKVVTKCGYYCWESTRDDEFNISNHVKLAIKDDQVTEEDIGGVHNYLNNNAPSPHSWTEEEALQKLSDMYSNPSPTTLPRWEIIVFPNYTYVDDSSPMIPTSEGKTYYYAMILRLHHSLMDGISSYHLLSYGLADYPEKSAIDPLKPLNIPFYVKFLQYLKLWALWPKMMYENTVVDQESNCFHGPDLSGPKIVGYTRPIEMDKIKGIRLNLKSSTAAVLNAAVGGSFHMLANNEGMLSPDRFTAVTSIPMLPYPNLKPQNRFSGAFFPLEVAGVKTRAERVLVTHATLKSIIQSPLVLLNSLLLRFIGILPVSVSQNLTDARELSILTSNVPGPNKHLCFFGGDRLVDVTGWLPIKNKTGFGICFVSYCGRVRAAIVADQAIASRDQVQFLTNALEQEIFSLEDELRSRDDYV